MSIMKPRESFSAAQCRAARGLLDWSAEDLARRARLECEAVELFERGEGALSERDRLAISCAFASAGVIAKAEASAGEGVRFRHPAYRPHPFGDEPGSPEIRA